MVTNYKSPEENLKMNSKESKFLDELEALLARWDAEIHTDYPNGTDKGFSIVGPYLDIGLDTSVLTKRLKKCAVGSWED